MSKVREAALAVCDRWESPQWTHDAPHTAELIFSLREALREEPEEYDLIGTYMRVADELCDGREWCIGGVSEPLRRFAALVAAAEREALPEEVCEAYGWLFHETSSERANRARRLLLTCMTKEQQKVGIQMAKEHGALVRRMSTRGE